MGRSHPPFCYPHLPLLAFPSLPFPLPTRPSRPRPAGKGKVCVEYRLSVSLAVSFMLVHLVFHHRKTAPIAAAIAECPSDVPTCPLPQHSSTCHPLAPGTTPTNHPLTTRCHPPMQPSQPPHSFFSLSHRSGIRTHTHHIQRVAPRRHRKFPCL